MRCFLTAPFPLFMAVCLVLGVLQSSIAGEGIVIKQENGGISLSGKGSGKGSSKSSGTSASKGNNFPDNYKEKVDYPTATGHEYHCGSNWVMVYLRTMIEKEDGALLDGGFPHCSQRTWKEGRKETCQYPSRNNPDKIFWGEVLFEKQENSNRCRFISAEYWVQERPKRGKDLDRKE